MGAWLERRVERCALSIFAGLLQRYRFSVGPPGGRGCSAADDFAVLDDYAADIGIGGRPAAGGFTEPRAAGQPPIPMSAA